MGGRGPGGQLGAKRLVQAKRQPQAVGKGRRPQLSTRFSAGARKPPATPKGACFAAYCVQREKQNAANPRRC